MSVWQRTCGRWRVGSAVVALLMALAPGAFAQGQAIRTLTCAPGQVPVSAGTGWVCGALPAGSDADKFVFVTSQAYTGNVGGLAGADYICGVHAAAAGLPGDYRAWLSSAHMQPNGRFTPSRRPYRLPTGAVVANDWGDLVTLKNGNYLRHPIDRDEFGQVIPAGSPQYVWTATAPQGWVTGDQNAAETCGTYGPNDAFSNGVSGAAPLGLVGAVTSHWSYVDYQHCNLPARLYCFQQ